MKSELELMFGEGSYVIINSCKYSTNNSSFVIDIKLMVSDIELTEEVYPDGLIILVEEAWKLMCIDTKITILTSIDIV